MQVYKCDRCGKELARADYSNWFIMQGFKVSEKICVSTFAKTAIKPSKKY